MPLKKKVKHNDEAIVATPTRRSTRNAEKAKRSSVRVPVVDSDASSADDEERVPKPSKGLRNMPLDILFEIFRFLTPGDLLNLARTNKKAGSRAS
ncbi:hypothetical protein C8Q80DRAFT_82786 [Daedaleopsis nitida]|nr:hypothetical protein C8Q80DRAFT_82786 [Daedaleopsis nitida]